MRNFAAILLMSIAYALLLGHSIVPHHHHESPDEIGVKHHHNGHHSQNHSHDSHNETNSSGNAADQEALNLGHLVMHFFHASDELSLHTLQKITTPIQSQLLFISTNVLSLEAQFKNPDIPKRCFTHKKATEYFSPHIYVAGLRAPPSQLS